MSSLTPALRNTLTLWHILEQSSLPFHRLVDTFSSPENALAQSPESWSALRIPPAKIKRLGEWQHNPADFSGEMLSRVEDWLSGEARTLLSLSDREFPQLLKEIDDPPPLLFINGDADLLQFPQIAIVGSRHATAGGLDNARQFAKTLALQGITVSSGLAQGIDGAAHLGALAANGKTIAVMGTGPDRIYPKSHFKLAHEVVAQGGSLVTEFLPGTPPLAPNFPRRNRIISGLSLGVLVIEAALQSGSLITARLALEQGRNVWALPGSIHNVQAKGCHVLIRDGAKLVDDINHILEDVEPLIGVIQSTIANPTAAVHFEGTAAQIIDALAWEKRDIDWIIDATGLGAGQVMSTLMELELDGHIANSNGQYERLNA